MCIQDADQHAGWDITAFNLPDLWASTRGEGVKVAVIDTGCQLDHFDLVDNLLPKALMSIKYSLTFASGSFSTTR